MEGHEALAAASLSVTSSDGTRIGVRAFPNEPEFLADVGRAVALAGTPPGAGDDELRQTLLDELRRAYPDVEIRIREELAGLGSGDRAWYVLRDGRVPTGATSAEPSR